MESLNRARGYLKGRLTRFTTYVNSLESFFTSEQQTLSSKQRVELQKRLDDLLPTLSEFYQIDMQMQEHNSDSADYETEFESMYYSAVSQAEDLLKKYKMLEERPHSSASDVETKYGPTTEPLFRLPAIVVPKFNGDSSDWIEYFEIFKNLIADNNALTDIQKLHYLKSSLQGNAAQLLKSLEFTSSNYSVAWSILCERYNDPRMLIFNHFKSILELESIPKESASKLRNFSDVLFKHFNAVKSLASDKDLLEFLMIIIISKKLDRNTLREWETVRNNKSAELPTLSEFKSFLKNTANLLETLEAKNNQIIEKPSRVQSRSLVTNLQSCLHCKENHLLHKCDEFLKLSIDDRLANVKKMRACLNCLAKGHFNNQCLSKYSCQKCKGKHHTILHKDKPQTSLSNGDSLQILSAPVDSNPSISALCSNNVHVLLPTATAKIICDDGSSRLVRILLDSGSQSNFIRFDLCKQLNIKLQRTDVTVSGVGKATSEIRARCDVNLEAQHASYKLSISCLVINEITGITPSCFVKRNSFKIPDNITLSDCNFDRPGSIDLLIGASIFWKLLCVGQLHLGPGQPILQKTKLGWIVSGPTTSISSYVTQCNLNCVEEPADALTRFWQLENYPTERVFTPEENECEDHFVQTMKRDSQGRFVVSIPCKLSPQVLGDSLKIAQKRFFALERRLQANSDLANRYNNFMEEYKALGHMSVVTPNPKNVEYYLPHHGVTKEDSVTTKLRVVFNGSQATTTGYSLNSIQMVGPTIQQDLFSILIRFRKHQIAIAADIEKMYRQVLIHPDQRGLQCILWRASPVDPILIYNLNTVTYGTTSASFLAIRCLMQLAKECKVSSPEVSRIIQEDFYVDDLLSGANTIEDAQRLCFELDSVLTQGCFKLRKWVSNNPQVLINVPSSEVHPSALKFGANEHTHTLGLIWCFQSDTFMFATSKTPDSNLLATKRTMLSRVAQIFDPLGLISPCTLGAKILIQKLWLEKLDWDDPIPLEIQEKWSSYCNELLDLNDLAIKRHVLCIQHVKVEMHGFCDASLQGYGACIYLRSVNNNENIEVNLLCSKARVAPLKPLTVPKLELCAAVLLAKLCEQVCKALNLKISRYLFWSDSMIVLGWLKTNPNLLKTFVCNRVADVQQLTSKGNWQHVPSKDNPADLLSRGTSPKNLKGSLLWWQGPEWLKGPEDSWPNIADTKVDLPETKGVSQCIAVDCLDYFPFNLYSNLNKLIRVIAYCLRFISNSSKPHTDRLFGSLSQMELMQSLHVLVRLAQREFFGNELKLLSRGKALKSSTLTSLSPFLDSHGLIRVGGRLLNSQFSFNKKFPLLISGKHPLARLLIAREHLRLLHAGPQLLLAQLRSNFWILGARNLTKKIVHNCVKCYRFSAQLTKPIMGNLPQSRLIQAPPFHICGVDYGGPLMVKDRKGRGSKSSKSYLCLFICFVTKAVHLELVTDLRTETFILALRRFVARRGKPLHIYSDNGTNFIGANSELKELGTFIKENNSKLTELINKECIQWHFIPAHSPHFGGLWEAGIKSCKFHLKRVIGLNTLTFEEMYTLLALIEATLNSRPISPLSSDPNDLEPLTPAHFLLGRPSASLPDPDLTHLAESRLSIFQKIQVLHQHIWKRWNKEFIVELQQRSKWNKTSSQLALDTLVLIKDDNAPPLNWKLGRIVEVHPGSDGVNRVASVKTISGIVKRSFSRLCPLPATD